VQPRKRHEKGAVVSAKRRNTEDASAFRAQVLATFDEVLATVTQMSGYPDNTVEGVGRAFTYGLIVGTLAQMRAEWKERD
jgi:hypothetical protein